MQELIVWLSQPWPWYVAGPMISIVMIALIYFGNTLGISSNLRTVCSAMGAGKAASFFDFNWKAQVWNLVFVAGLVVGGWIASTVLANPEPLKLSGSVLRDFDELGISLLPGGLVPYDLFAWETLLTFRGFMLMIVGGFLVGFGSRYAGGCTSGHAISGLSNLQLPSLLAVAGFFLGGLISVYIFFPLIF